MKLLNERSSVSNTGERARLAGTEPLSFAKLISKCFSDVRLLKRAAIARMHFNEQRKSYEDFCSGLAVVVLHWNVPQIILFIKHHSEHHDIRSLYIRIQRYGSIQIRNAANECIICYISTKSALDRKQILRFSTISAR